MIVLFLIAPILWFSFPNVFQGTTNINMIHHFSADEASLVRYAGKTYSQIVAPLEYNVTYPQLYYYVAGTILIPYTFFKGIDYQLISIVLRCVNVLAALLTVIMLYFFCMRFFKSIWIAVISGLLLSTSPEYLSWLTNARPHILEIFFLLSAFYFCFKLIQEYNHKIIIAMVGFMGLATATKFGGIFMIPVAWMAYFYANTKLEIEKIIEYLKSQSRLIYFISFFTMTVSLFIPFIAILIYLKIPEKFQFFGINSLCEFLRFRNFRLISIVMGLVFLWSFTWFMLNWFSKKCFSDIHYSKKYFFFFLLNRSFLFLVCMVFSMIVIFLVFNPTYVLFPFAAVKEMGLQFAKSSLGTNYNPGLEASIINSEGLRWFKMLFENTIFNIWFGLLLFFYAVFEISGLKKNLSYSKSRDFILQRGLFWLYCFFMLLFLFLFVKHRPYHYLLSTSMVLGVLLSYGIVQMIKQTKIRMLKRSLIVFFSFILILGFYVRFEKLLFIYNLKADKPNDTGLIVGRWLENHYIEEAVIWTDTNEFYVPPKFKNVYFMYWQDNIADHFSYIKELNPDVLVITSELDYSLKNAHKIIQAIESNILEDFKLVKVFDYQGPLALKKSDLGQAGLYKNIYIFIKNNSIRIYNGK